MAINKTVYKRKRLSYVIFLTLFCFFFCFFFSVFFFSLFFFQKSLATKQELKKEEDMISLVFFFSFLFNKKKVILYFVLLKTKETTHMIRISNFHSNVLYVLFHNIGIAKLLFICVSYCTILLSNAKITTYINMKVSRAKEPF